MSNGSESFVVVLDKLSEVAFRYGPSFFALLFLLFLVRTASQEYQKVLCRADPPPQSAEKGVYAGLLIGSWIAGVVLVAVSVWFFLFTHQIKHTFEAMIVDLHPTAVITMDNGYTKRMIRPIEGARPFQDYYIAILRDRPFRRGERFSLRYIPELRDSGSGSPPTWSTVVLEIDSIDRGIAHFKIADDAAGKFQLVRLQ